MYSMCVLLAVQLVRSSSCVALAVQLKHSSSCAIACDDALYAA
jgi:hypothetical protein